MRPLTLTLRGLRSYVDEQDVDFTDIGLMAVHGPTGAGKSSLLEALCFALYGGCTWDKRNAIVLIADGVNTMQVRLTFRSGNKTWQVTRSVSRTSSPLSRHELVCLDDGARYDTKQQVNAAIEKMIGLSHDAFLKAVVLPQGRFQALLHTTREDRTAILKGILGIDQLDIVRAMAMQCHDRMRPQLEHLVRERQALLPDPPATAEQAAAQLASATARGNDLTQARQAARAAAGRRDHLLERQATLDRHAQRLHEARVPGAADQLNALLDLDETITAQLDELGQAIVAAEADEQRLGTLVQVAEDDGRGPTDLAKAIATIESARDQLPDIEAEQTRIDEEARVLADELTRVEEHTSAVDQAVAVAENAEAAATAARVAADSARKVLSEHRSALGTARTALQNLRRAEVELTEVRAQAARADETIRQAWEQVEQARRRRDTADLAHQAAVRADAAAQAAHGCEPGDPCPVCHRELPAGFTAPEAHEEKAARKALGAAQRATAQAELGHQAAVTSREHLTGECAKVKARVDACGSDLREAMAHLEPQLGTVDLDKADDALLAPLTARLVGADEQAQAAAARASHARAHATGAKTHLEITVAALATREAALTTARRQVKQRLARTAKAFEKLPPAWRPDNLGVDSLGQLLDRANQCQRETAALVERLRDAQSQVKQGRKNREELTGRHLIEVERPANATRVTLTRLHAVAMDATAIIGSAVAPAPPADSLSATAAWAITLDQAARDLISSAREQARRAKAEADEADADSRAVIRAASAGDLDELEALLVQASADAKVAEELLLRARHETPIAADLHERITASTPVVEALRELAGLLANGQFQAAVVARRQRAFLGLATDQLLSMTAGRFAFSDDFRIIDRYTSQPRDARTLSGGETFLASMALSLAVVDLASRAGGRAEALFLDEGFGSLDAETLAEALAALSRQTLGGRVVAVISHMRAVAETIGNVLLVSRDNNGSRAHWASEAERSQLVDDDVAEALHP